MAPSVPWRTRIRMVLALLLLPFAPFASVVAGTLVFGAFLHPIVVLDAGVALTNRLALAISFGVAFAFALAFQGRTLWRAFSRALSSPLAGLETREPDAKLESTVQQLAAQADVEQPRLRVVETETPEAFTVRERGRATIAVSDGLLAALDPDGRTAVLAHEIAHLQSRDVAVMRRVTIPLAAADEMREVVERRREDGDHPFVGALMQRLLALYGAACAGIVSAGREYGADAGAAALTGDPAALAAALATLDAELARAPERDLRARSDVVALNVVPTASRGLLSTHPPTEKRIERLEAMAAEQ